MDRVERVGRRACGVHPPRRRPRRIRLRAEQDQRRKGERHDQQVDDPVRPGIGGEPGPGDHRHQQQRRRARRPRRPRRPRTSRQHDPNRIGKQHPRHAAQDIGPAITHIDPAPPGRDDRQRDQRPQRDRHQPPVSHPVQQPRMDRVGEQLEQQRPLHAVEEEHPHHPAAQCRHEQQFGRQHQHGRGWGTPAHDHRDRAEHDPGRHHRIQPPHPRAHERPHAEPGREPRLVGARHHEAREHEEEVDRQIAARQQRDARRRRPHMMDDHHRRRHAAHSVEDHQASGRVHPRTLPPPAFQLGNRGAERPDGAVLHAPGHVSPGPALSHRQPSAASPSFGR